MCQACQACGSLIIITISTCVLVFLKLYYFSYGTQQKQSSGIRKIFLPLKNLSFDSTQLYVYALYVCIVTNLMAILIFGQVFQQEKAGICGSWRRIVYSFLFKIELLQAAVCCSCNYFRAFM